MKIINKHFSHINSTNSWALQNAHTLDRDALTVINANEQSQGRGRLQRQWHSPAGTNLYASFCLFTGAELQTIANISQVLALACAELLATLSLAPTLKWPNDLLVNGKKIAGILSETKPIDETRLLVIGIGLNINMSEEELSNINKPATSVLIETSKEHNPQTILTLLEEKFQLYLETYLKEGFAAFHAAFTKLLRFDDEMEFSTDQIKVKGKIVKINPDGSIMIELKDGERKTFYYGEFV